MASCCGDNRFTLIERAKRDFIESTNISDEELKVLDTMCFRMWQLGLLKKYDDTDEDKRIVIRNVISCINWEGRNTTIFSNEERKKMLDLMYSLLKNRVS